MISLKNIIAFYVSLFLVCTYVHSSQSPERAESPVAQPDARRALLCSSPSSGNNSLGQSDIPQVPGTPRNPQIAKLQRQLSAIQLEVTKILSNTIVKEQFDEVRKQARGDNKHHAPAAERADRTPKQDDNSGALESTTENSVPVVRTRKRSESQVLLPTTTKPVSMPNLGQSGSYTYARTSEMRSDSREAQHSTRKETASIAPLTQQAFTVVAEAKKSIQEELAAIERNRRDLDTQERELYEELGKVIKEEAIIVAFDRHMHSLNVLPNNQQSSLNILGAPNNDPQGSLRNTSQSSSFIPTFIPNQSQNSTPSLSAMQQFITLQNPLLAAVISLAVYISHDEKMVDRLGKLFDRILNWAKQAPQPASSPQQPTDTAPPIIPDIIATHTTHNTNEAHNQQTTKQKQNVVTQTLCHTLFCKKYLQSLISESLFANAAQTIAPYLISSLHVQNGWKYMACYIGTDIGGTLINECARRIMPHKKLPNSFAHTRPKKNEHSISHIAQSTAKAIIAYYISSHT